MKILLKKKKNHQLYHDIKYRFRNLEKCKRKTRCYGMTLKNIARKFFTEKIDLFLMLNTVSSPLSPSEDLRDEGQISTAVFFFCYFASR